MNEQSALSRGARLWALLQDNRRDYRFVVFGVVSLYMLVLLFSELYFGSYAVIGKVLWVDPQPYFRDLRILLCGVDAIRAGADPYTCPCIDGVAYYNYPYLWGVLSVVPFISNDHLMALGFALVLAVYAALYAFMSRINLFGALVYTALMSSSAIMLCFERANSDLIVLLLLLATVCRHRSLFALGLGVLVASSLKLYPIGAVLSLFNVGRPRFKASAGTLLVVLALFVLYLAIAKDNILMVSHRTPRPYGQAAYGLGTIPSILKAQYDWSNRTHVIPWIYGGLFCVGFVAICWLGRPWLGALTIDHDFQGTAYLVGSGIFVTTCLIGYNWEYRLVFLLLTVPQTLRWAEAKKPAALVFLTLSIIVVWQSLVEGAIELVWSPREFDARTYLVFSQSLVVLLFYGHVYVLGAFAVRYLQSLRSTAGSLAVNSMSARR